jgi:hypothetical protein
VFAEKHLKKKAIGMAKKESKYIGKFHTNHFIARNTLEHLIL